jgi:hypothetical protein
MGDSTTLGLLKNRVAYWLEIDYIVMNLNDVHADEGMPILNAITEQELIPFQRRRRNPYEVRPRNLSILEELLKCAV